VTNLLPRQWTPPTTPTFGQPGRLPHSHARRSSQGTRSHTTKLRSRRRHSAPTDLDPITQDPPQHAHQHDRLVTAQSHTPYYPEASTHHGHTQSRKARLLGTQGLPNDISPADTIKDHRTCHARQNDSFRTQLPLTILIRLPERLFRPRRCAPNTGKSAQSVKRQAIQLSSLPGRPGYLRQGSTPAASRNHDQQLLPAIPSRLGTIIPIRQVSPNHRWCSLRTLIHTNPSGHTTRLAPITLPFQRLQLPAMPQLPKSRRGPHGILCRQLLLAGNFSIMAAECHHPHSCWKPATTRSQPRKNELRPLEDRTVPLPLWKQRSNCRPPRGTIRGILYTKQPGTEMGRSIL